MSFARNLLRKPFVLLLAALIMGGIAGRIAEAVVENEKLLLPPNCVRIQPKAHVCPVPEGGAEITISETAICARYKRACLTAEGTAFFAQPAAQVFAFEFPAIPREIYVVK